MAKESGQPALSVMMPVYNGERYVAEATESVLNQSFRDFEFIIVDDGSTDGSLEILQRYAAEDERIRLVSRENRGLVATLNEGIALACAPVIARMDADDISIAHRFQAQVDFLNTNPECVLVGSGRVLIDSGGRKLGGSDWLVSFASHEAIVDNLLKGHCCIVHPSTMFRVDAVRQLGGYREEFRHCEDYDLWLRLSEIGKLVNIPEPLLLYRDHESAVTTVHNVEQFENTRRAFKEACERRGVSAVFERTEPHRGGKRAGKPDRTWYFQRYKLFWWYAYNEGYWSTAFHYALRCIRQKFWWPSAWWLLFKTIAGVVFGSARNRP